MDCAIAELPRLYAVGDAWPALACQQAALAILQWACANGCLSQRAPIQINPTLFAVTMAACRDTALYGDLDELQRLVARGEAWDESTCNYAAMTGHLHVLQWAHENGCPWDTNTCEHTACSGHLNVLQWARTNGCPWNETTCSSAARSGFLKILQWARANNCPWSDTTCTHAAMYGHLNILQWARAHGCPWNKAKSLVIASDADTHAWITSGAGDHNCPTKSAAPRAQ